LYFIHKGMAMSLFRLSGHVSTFRSKTQRNCVSRASVRTAIRSAVERLEGRTLLSTAPRISSLDFPTSGVAAMDEAFIDVGFSGVLAPVELHSFQLTSLDDPSMVIPVTRFHVSFAPSDPIASFQAPLKPGHYRFRVISGDGHIESAYGDDLDGEYSGTLPTGNGTPGGDFIADFTVVAPMTRPEGPAWTDAHAVSSTAIEITAPALSYAQYGSVLERAEGDSPFQVLGNASSRASVDSTVTFTDSTAQPGITYRYQISMRGPFVAGGNVWSDPSPQASAQVLPPEQAIPVSPLLDTNGLHPDWLTTLGNSVCFTLSNNNVPYNWRAENGQSLWKTDGTPAGTIKLFDGPARELIAFGNNLYFSGYTAAHGWELYKSDGTAAGTLEVSDLASGNASSEPRMLGVYGGKLFFALPVAGHGYSLWQTDGVSAPSQVTSTLIYLDDKPNTAFKARPLFTVSGGYTYFRRADDSGVDTRELWRTGGSGAEAQVSGIADPEWLTDWNGELYLSAESGHYTLDTPNDVTGRGLWKVSPGSLSGTLVKQTTDSYHNGIVDDLTPFGDHLLFVGSHNNDMPDEIWSTDGTASGTFSITPRGTDDLGYGSHAMITSAGSRAYFQTYTTAAQHGSYLYSTDGTAAGLQFLRDTDTRMTDSPVFVAAASGERAVFSSGDALWISDGSRFGTRQIDALGVEADSAPRTSESDPSIPSNAYGFAGASSVIVGDRLFYSLKLPNGGRELRVADLTPPAAPDQVAVAPEAGGSAALGGYAPHSVTVSAAGNQVSWHDNAVNEIGYTVDRFAPGGSVAQATFYVAAGATSLNDSSAAAGSSYRVRAYNAGGFSAGGLAGATVLTGDIVNVSPDPRATSVGSISITFNHTVFGLSLADLKLSRDGGPNLLTSAARLRTADGKTFTLSGIDSVTSVGGAYELRLAGGSTGVVDGFGQMLPADVTDAWINSTPLPAAYKQGTDANALVSIDAEKPDGNVSKSSKTWQKITGTNYAGGAAMKVNPNTGTTITTNVANTSPRLDYRINFNKTGVHYVWIRGLAASTADDTVHVGLEGVLPSTSDNMNGFGSSLKWSKSTLDGAVATINVTSVGVHTLNLWMREDGFVADKIVLTKNSSYVPSGSGPALSAHASPTPPVTTFHIRAGADALVRDGTYATKNFGTQSTLEVKQSTSAGSTREAYLRFDTSAAATVNSVKLRLFGKLSDSSASKVNISVYSLANTTWSETGITWSKPPIGATTLRGTMGVTGTAGQWFELDLTSFVKAERAAGRKIISLKLKGAATSGPFAIFNSDEATTNRPELVVA
jgi:ELWxxDGT repeat protein